MMTREENEMLCKVRPGRLMGELFRQYQTPVLLSKDLEAGGPPMRVRLLGEDLVAYRAQNGKVGLIGEFCAHLGHEITSTPTAISPLPVQLAPGASYGIYPAQVSRLGRVQCVGGLV